MLGWIEPRQDGARTRAKSMPPQLPVGGQQSGPKERGQFPGRGAPQQVHLKIAVLAVHVPQSAGQIAAAAACDGRDARRIAHNGDASRETGQRRVSVDGRQTGAQREPRRSRGCEHDRQHRREAGAEKSPHRAEDFIRRTVASNASLVMRMWPPRSAESARQRCRHSSECMSGEFTGLSSMASIQDDCSHILSLIPR